MKQKILKIIYGFLSRFAKRVIAHHKPFVIAVSGSVGKTTTKDAIFTLIHQQYGSEVRKSYGNLNAEIGVPLTILGYDALPNKFLWPFFLIEAYFRSFRSKYFKYIVLELGIEKPGDMEYFGEIFKPNIAVLTSASGAHVGNFKNLGEYQEEKAKLVHGLAPNGAAVLNFDDDYLKALQVQNRVTYGINNKEAQFFAEEIKHSLKGTDYRIAGKGHKISIKTKLLGSSAVYSQLAAFSVAHILGIPFIKAGKMIEKIEPIPGRLNLIEGKKSVQIIDDTYNSNPSSASLALDLLASICYDSGRKVIIFGDMNELGRESDTSHVRIGQYAKDKCDFAVFIGKNAEKYSDGFGRENALVFKNKEEFIDKWNSYVRENDLILIKASQNNNYFEEIIKVLMKKPEISGKLLVRQSSFWLRKKRIK